MEKRKQTYKRYERSKASLTLELDWRGRGKRKKHEAGYRTILSALWRYRLLSTEQIGVYLGVRRSHYRLLSKLYHAGYVDRRYVPFDEPHGHGSPQTLHLLTRKGLSEITAPEVRSNPDQWQPLRERVRQIVNRADRTLQHDLSITRLHLVLDLGAELVTWVGDRETGQPLRVRHPVRSGAFFQRWPDAFFTLLNDGRHVPFFLELDLETARHARKRELVEDRFLVYSDALKNGTLESRSKTADRVPAGSLVGFTGRQSINVLFVTLDTKRRDRHVEIAQEMLNDSGPRHLRRAPFWFTSLEDILVHRIIGDLQTGRQRTTVDYDASADRLVNEDVLVGLNGRPSRLLA